jgi:hypothetical protein
MKMNRTLIVATISAVIISCSAHAGNVDWSVSYEGTVDQSQTAGSQWTGYGMNRNAYGWDRNVSAWQEFQAGVSGSLGGIAVDMNFALAGGSVDLNIYSGEGVQGTLLESTQLQWTDALEFNYTGQWCTFLLDAPVELTSGSTYTFSFENLSFDDAFGYVVVDSGNPYPNGDYMMQGYFWGNTFGYTTGSTTADMNFQTIMEPITEAPEPSTLALSAVAGLGLLLFRRRK